MMIQLVRIALEYIDRQTKQVQELNKLTKYAMMALKCCALCFEKIVKYLTRNAYIYIAITGENFLSSAWVRRACCISAPSPSSYGLFPYNP